MRTAIVAALLTLLGSTCVASEDDRFSKAEADDIREAVFRHQITTEGVNLCFLTIDNGDGNAESDPPAVFLKRFSNAKASVRMHSDIKRQGDSRVVTDSATGEKGAELRVGEVTRFSETQAKVHGAVIHDGESVAGYIYIVEKGKGGWGVRRSLLREGH